jgi:hypothetical protein
MAEPQFDLPQEQRQAILDAEHLKLLAIGYLISAAMSALFSLLGLVYVFLGLVMRSVFANLPEAARRPGQAPPPEIFWLFTFIGAFLFLAMVTLAILKARVAWCLKRRRSRVFCLVVAGLTCLGIPYGTALGVFTFLALGRDSVQRLFAVDTPS